ncbi:MAG: PQQ-binding-like beta-propeller repeat protein, partial [Planctomycetaceae bacterium]
VGASLGAALRFDPSHPSTIRAAVYQIPAAALFLAMLAALALESRHELAAADWRQFRGSDSTSVAAESDPPIEWGPEKNIAWKADLPGRGLSAPIVVAGRVIVTASSGVEQDRLHVSCFDQRTGAKRWERRFQATGRTQCHGKTCVAAPTPASDGERVFAFYSSNDVVCLDLEGALVWHRGLGFDFPNASNSLGMSSSPVVSGETLVVQVESDDDSFAVGLDTASGVSRWKIARPNRANWSSPLSLGEGGVLLQSSAGVTAIDPRTGRELWSYDDGASTIPSSVAADGAVFVPSHGITALRPGGTGEPPEQAWREAKLRPATASPIVLDGRILALNSAGVLTAADAQSGEEKWRLRLEGPFSASPVAAGGRLYFFNETGLGFVVQPGESEGKIVGRGDLAETILGTPAVAGDALFVRSDGHLWKIGQ